MNNIEKSQEALQKSSFLHFQLLCPSRKVSPNISPCDVFSCGAFSGILGIKCNDSKKRTPEPCKAENNVNTNHPKKDNECISIVVGFNPFEKY